jgi:hypothetical protein
VSFAARQPPVHAAQPGAFGVSSELPKHADAICRGRNSALERRTYDAEQVTCPGCRRRLDKYPQLVIAMRMARQVELPATEGTDDDG